MEINVKIATDAPAPSTALAPAPSPPDRRLDGLQTATEITFNANDSDGADLKAAFDKMKATVKEFGGMESLDGVNVTQDGDSVIVSVPMTSVMQDEPEQELEATFENQPEINANFKFGSDLDTIFDITSRMLTTTLSLFGAAFISLSTRNSKGLSSTLSSASS